MGILKRAVKEETEAETAAPAVGTSSAEATAAPAESAADDLLFEISEEDTKKPKLPLGKWAATVLGGERRTDNKGALNFVLNMQVEVQVGNERKTVRHSEWLRVPFAPHQDKESGRPVMNSDGSPKRTGNTWFLFENVLKACGKPIPTPIVKNGKKVYPIRPSDFEGPCMIEVFLGEEFLDKGTGSTRQEPKVKFIHKGK